MEAAQIEVLKKSAITAQLQDLLEESPWIDNVYLAMNGRIYLYAHALIAKQGDTKKELYGEGTFSHSIIIPGEWNVDNLREQIASGVEESKIVKVIPRQEVLDYQVNREKSSLVNQTSNLTADEKQRLLAELLPSDMYEALRKLASGS